MSTITSSHLCIKCGICCDGTAFGQVTLESNDLNTVTQEISLVDLKDKRILKQPCAALLDCTCTIYPNRPGVCVAYECKLLKEYMRGKVAENLAHRIINSVKLIKEEIEILLKKAGNENDTEDIHTRMRDFERGLISQMPILEYRQLNGPLLLKYKILQKLLIDRFGLQFKGENKSL